MYFLGNIVTLIYGLMAGGSVTPPTTNFRVTDSLDQRITDAGNDRIIDN